jgi:L-alanine-DL-glutamate epimerase-like enolase superfamily enzyme
MKITEVRTYSPVYPVKDPFSNAMRTTRERAFGIVEVITDSGVTGLGEGAAVPARIEIDREVLQKYC